MNKDKVREAIAWLVPFYEDISITSDHIEAVNTLIKLAKKYLKSGSGKIGGWGGVNNE